MANSKSAAKRARQSSRRTLRNRKVVSNLRSLTKVAKVSTAADGHRALISALDRAAKRGIIHRNVANRRKARLNRVPAKSQAA